MTVDPLLSFSEPYVFQFLIYTIKQSPFCAPTYKILTDSRLPFKIEKLDAEAESLRSLLKHYYKTKHESKDRSEPINT